MTTDGQPLPDRQLRAWMNFMRGSHLLDQRIERQLKADGGLSHPEFEILVSLDSQPDGLMRMSDLARRVVVSKSRLTYQIDRLERAGLVRRSLSPQDGRVVRASLTDLGRETIARVRPGHRATVRECLIDVLTDEELDVLRDALGRVVDKLGGRPS
jgi:DNA-binding MarR family transcriptional regulator